MKLAQLVIVSGLLVAVSASAGNQASPPALPSAPAGPASVRVACPGLAQLVVPPDFWPGPYKPRFNSSST